MKKLLLSIFAFALGTVANAAETVLWEDAEGVEVSWGSQNATVQDATVGAMLKVGDELIVTVSGTTDADQWPQVLFKGVSWDNACGGYGLWDVSEFPHEAVFTVTQDMIDVMQNGFWVSGAGAVVTKLVYREVEQEYDLTGAIWIGNTTFPDTDSWGINFSIEGNTFLNAKAGDYIQFRFSEMTSAFFLQLFFGGWDGIKINSGEYPDEYVIDNEAKTATIRITPEYYDALVAGGLVVQAGGCTVRVVALVEGEAIISDDPQDEYVLWEGEFGPIGWNEDPEKGEVNVFAYTFQPSEIATMTKGASLKFEFVCATFEDEGDNYWIAQFMGGWWTHLPTPAASERAFTDDNGNELLGFAQNETSYEFLVGPEDLSILRQQGSIKVVGHGLVITALKLIPTPAEETEPTAIQTVNETQADNAWYTLEGVRVANPQKGIYIHNGKKFVVK